MYKRYIKRLLDILISSIGLICFGWFLILVAIWLHFANKGAGVFFLQERPGKDEKIFKLIKFKTMTDERDDEGNLLPDAQRITKVGKFIRSTSIDELPQLINVLKGDMSLIGPRPLLIKYIPYYSEREILRHTVKPGLTGWAQVNGRNHVMWEQRFEYDAYYAENVSLKLDTRIFIKTIQNVLARRDIEAVTNLIDFDIYRNSIYEEKVFLAIEDVSFDGLNIKVVRDDLFPSVGGGTKARKALGYEKHLRENGYNAIVTCGGVNSNHNRAIALMAMRNGWKCHIVIHGDKKEFYKGLGNSGIILHSGAEVEFTDVKGISEAMDIAMDKFAKEGLKPYYIHGGGHDLPGCAGIIDAIKELKHQTPLWKPDYIFVASGTGGTQAGIRVGLDMYNWSDVKLVGISVAREEEYGKKVIIDFANCLSRALGFEKDYSDEIILNSSYVGKGYGIKDAGVENFLKYAKSQTGLMLDPIYSGKAFRGMIEEIKSKGLQDKKILFWLTGGPINASY